MIESNLLPPERKCFNCDFVGMQNELKPISMWYRNSILETMYRERPDTHFRFDLICVFILFGIMMSIQFITFGP